VLQSGRGASDFFLLEASLDGVGSEILCDHSTVRVLAAIA
jgi:hypothetical protein